MRPHKFVASSDWHRDHVSLGVARALEIDRAVYQTVEYAKKAAADSYVFLGDLTDPDSGLGVFAHVAAAEETAVDLRAAGISSHWLAGNHDVIEDGSGTTTLTPMRALVEVGSTPSGARVLVHERPALVEFDGFNALFLPYTATSHAYLPEALVEDAPEDLPLLVVAHLSVPGVIPGEETNEMPRGREVTLPLDALAEWKRRSGKRLMVWNGHYHRRQNFRADNGVVVNIPGALARLTFGEQEHTPSFFAAEFP